MILTICLLILVYTILGKDVKPLLEKLKNVDWKRYCHKAWIKIRSYAAIIYTVVPTSFIPARLYRFRGLLDEGAAIFFVVNKVRDKMTPAIGNKVQDILDEWFDPKYSVSDAKA